MDTLNATIVKGDGQSCGDEFPAYWAVGSGQLGYCDVRC